MQVGLFLIYVCVLNVFLTRKGSVILHLNKFVFLIVFCPSSCDVTVMSTQFLHVGGSDNATF